MHDAKYLLGSFCRTMAQLAASIGIDVLMHIHEPWDSDMTPCLGFAGPFPGDCSADVGPGRVTRLTKMMNQSIPFSVYVYSTV